MTFILVPISISHRVSVDHSVCYTYYEPLFRMQIIKKVVEKGEFAWSGSSGCVVAQERTWWRFARPWEREMSNN